MIGDLDRQLLRDLHPRDSDPPTDAIDSARAHAREALLVEIDRATSTAARGGRIGRRRRRMVRSLRGLTAMATIAAAAVAIVWLTQSSSGESAWARQTLQRAADVVIPTGSANTILHIAITQTRSPLAQRRSETTVSALSEQAWIQGSYLRERVIVQDRGGPVLEENENGLIYNQTTNTVYATPQFPKGKPHYTLTPTSSGSYRLSVTIPHGGVDNQTVDARTARALRAGTDVVDWGAMYFDRSTQTTRLGVFVGPSSPQPQQPRTVQPDPASRGFAAELRVLLNSGQARVKRTTTSDGQPAIEISTVHGASEAPTNYYVNPHTYAPIELDTFGYDTPKDVTRVHFTTYETLPLAGHEQLIRVTVPPTAHHDHTPADYWNASGRPF
jgi:hypothetical protein